MNTKYINQKKDLKIKYYQTKCENIWMNLK